MPEIMFSAAWAAQVTGLVAVAAIVIALVASARMKWLTKTFGLGGTYSTHRMLGITALLAVAFHIMFVLFQSWTNVDKLFLWSGTAASKSADVSTYALMVLIGSAMWRHRRNYDQWRHLHLILAGVVTISAALHVFWLDHLIKDPMGRAWFIAVASLALLGGLHRRVWSPLRHGPYQVVRVHPESPSVSTVTLAPRQGRHRPNKRGAHFAPGQFGWLRLHRRAASADHPYSFSSSAHESHRVQVTVKRGGKFTEDLVRSRPGRPVWVDGPHGSFTPSADASGLVLIAAGVGMTPMMSMLRTCADRRDLRQIRLIQSADSPAELLFAAEVDQLTRVMNLKVTRVLTRPHPEWRGPVGHIDLMVLHGALPATPLRKGYEVFICGPPKMVSDTVATLTMAGVPSSRIRTEQFLMPSPKGQNHAPKHYASTDSGSRGPVAPPPRRGGVGRPASSPSSAEPELHHRRPTEPPVGARLGDSVRVDRDGPPTRPLPRSFPGAERVRGGHDPRPRHR